MPVTATTPLKLALSAGGWISQLLGHEAAIDQHDLAVVRS